MKIPQGSQVRCLTALRGFYLSERLFTCMCESFINGTRMHVWQECICEVSESGMYRDTMDLDD